MSGSGFTAAELADRLAGRLLGNGGLVVEGPGDIHEPSPCRVVYALGREACRRALDSGFGLVITDQEPETVRNAVLLTPDPVRAYHDCLRLFADRVRRRPGAGIHPDAIVGAGCRIPETVHIGPRVVLGEGVSLGERCVIRAAAVIGDGVVFGDGAEIGEHAVIHAGTRAGDQVRIGPGTVVGGDGFGFDGGPGRGWEPVPQLGGVRIEDDVIIGANCTIDRGTAGDTVIGRGSRLDNLVHIAHNVRLGPDNLVVAQTGLAGSVVTGEGCVFGGQVGVSDHCRIGDRVVVGSKSGVQRHGLKSDTRYWGNPARPMEESARINAALRRLPALIRKQGDN